VPVAVLPPRPCSLCRTGWDGARWYPLNVNPGCPVHCPVLHLSDRDGGRIFEAEFLDPHRPMAVDPVCAAGCGRPAAVNRHTGQPTRYCSRSCGRAHYERTARARRKARGPRV